MWGNQREKSGNEIGDLAPFAGTGSGSGSSRRRTIPRKMAAGGSGAASRRRIPSARFALPSHPPVLDAF